MHCRYEPLFAAFCPDRQPGCLKNGTQTKTTFLSNLVSQSLFCWFAFDECERVKWSRLERCTKYFSLISSCLYMYRGCPSWVAHGMGRPTGPWGRCPSKVSPMSQPRGIHRLCVTHAGSYSHHRRFLQSTLLWAAKGDMRHHVGGNIIAPGGACPQ